MSAPASTDDGYHTLHDEDDASHLHALGYKSEFKRDMSPWANFSLGFTYLSPVVGVYTLFAYALATGGPPMIWSFLIVGVGQLLVALIFSEIVAQFPVAGGVYPWARRLFRPARRRDQQPERRRIIAEPSAIEERRQRALVQKRSRRRRELCSGDQQGDGASTATRRQDRRQQEPVAPGA